MDQSKPMGSAGSIPRGSTASVVRDRYTGRVYRAVSGEPFPIELDPGLAARLPSVSFRTDSLPAINCSECQGLNSVLLDGAKAADLEIYTFRPRTVKELLRCENCRITVPSPPTRVLSDHQMVNARFECPSTPLAKLTHAGWLPGRSVDTWPYERTLGEEGYELPPIVVKFLSEFGGLSVVYDRPPDNHDTISLDAKMAAGDVFPEDVAVYSSLVGASLCPVGEYYWGRYIILMDQNGRTYGAVDQIINYLGEGGAEAVQNIISGENIVRLFGSRIP